MKLVISRSLIKTAAQRWKGQYFRGGQWSMGGPSSINPEQVYEQLRQLDSDTCPAKAVDDIIGNQSWSHYFCGSCHEYVERAVQFGAEYNESDSILCISCIRLALGMFHSEPPQSESSPYTPILPPDIGLNPDVFMLPEGTDRHDLEWCAVIAQSAWREGTFFGRTTCRAINTAIGIAIRALKGAK